MTDNCELIAVSVSRIDVKKFDDEWQPVCYEEAEGLDVVEALALTDKE